ncbi:hypothetical protein RND81_06G234200 [Saponaria officinalis]|uniref:Ubiquitin-like domain-containing protein n=1 Tax=Saponaria officinalis TaxID=3572 RepID=A0AAW1KET2_SAPOF
MDACSLAENPITVRVQPAWEQEVKLEGLSLSDTVSFVLDEIVKKFKETGILCPQPEDEWKLMLLSGRCLKRDTTLASAVNLTSGNDMRISNTIRMILLPPLIPHDINGELWSIPEREDPDMFVENSSEEDEEDDGDCYRCPFYYKGKRGKEPIFEVMSDLGINGDIKLLDENDQPISLSKVWDVASIVTDASAVLLAPNDRILKELYALNNEKRYVVLRIDIDLLSYVFLRVFRECFPAIPIVAVTDFDPAHLDIVAFLDSDVGIIRRLYKLDLIHYERSAIDVAHIKEVDIKWLGLRYAHRGKLLPEADFDALAHPVEGGFDKVMLRLLKNRNVYWKNSWFRELRHLKKYHKRVEFPSCGYESIASMISDEDWVN